MALLFQPGLAVAGQAEPKLHPPLWTSLPFVLLLLAIALLPLLAGSFWHFNRNKALVVGLLSFPVIVYLLGGGLLLPGVEVQAAPLPTEGSPAATEPDGLAVGAQALLHALTEYGAFIVLLAALYTVSGGIVIRAGIPPTPLHNAGLLALGSLLANLVGTTGASMLLIRPVLQINRSRQNTQHLPVFFIFLVSNLGGLLTPLGDPPLFLGFLNGVSFLWTLSLLPQWALANAAVLTIFLAWDTVAYRSEPFPDQIAPASPGEPFALRGRINLLFLGGIVAAVMLQSRHLSATLNSWLEPIVPGVNFHLSQFQSALVMVTMAAGSLVLTSRELHQANGFSWGAINEVAILFAGIFITMVPALALLGRQGPSLGISQPWEFFWLSGGLSSFLDNAPTYLTFATLAAGGENLASLAQSQPLVLQAISCGSVFMGANTYIGNGPNFMVKAIADEAGFKTPSFFGYMAYAGIILLPVFVVMSFLFFQKG